MLAIRLPPEIEERLEALARRTGRSKTFYARQAILYVPRDLPAPGEDSFSEASALSTLDRPTVVPPQPPTTNEQCESPTGNVVVQKKSLPSIRLPSLRDRKSCLP